MTDPATGLGPALGPGDVYVHAHANGALFVAYGDGRSLLAPLPEVMAIVAGCHRAGGRVVVAGDDAPLAIAALDRIRADDGPVEAFAASGPPQTWPDGTDALIEAAALGTDALLDDLVARGADVHHRDGSGSTALHHAAAHGNVHAIEALAAAGADLDLVNERGSTPLMLARACREPAAAERLLALGADPAAGQEGSVRFGRAHLGTRAVWALPPIVGIVLLAVTWPLGPAVLVAVLVTAVAYAAVLPPRASWAGGAARRLDGVQLTIGGVLGRTRVVDLAQVTAAGLGGVGSRPAFRSAGWLLLAHPDGHPVTARTLRRLQVPPADVDALLGRSARYVAVGLDGVRGDEVLLAVGTLLSGRGVDLSPALRDQLARARDLAPSRTGRPSI